MWKLRTKYKENKRSKDVSKVLSCTCKSIVHKTDLKGQLISECLLVVFNFPKNQLKNLMNFYPRIKKVIKSDD